jgi:hypothetical protein
MKKLYKYTCEHCGKDGESKYEDKRFCNQRCSSAAWRLRNPREFKGRDWESKHICGNDGQRRDTPALWLKYMKENKGYYESLGKMTNRFNQRRAE